jgi:radical SAM superfamily enzyme YgiQ (UPF0313 family)
MGRLWQAAGTVRSVLMPGLLEKAVACGLRSLFVGFETLDPGNLRAQRKGRTLNGDYDRAENRLHDLGVMINASFVFGLDADRASTIDRTVEWAIQHGLETATFHILTPYPGTALHDRLERENRILHRNWDLYDTRHAVFRPEKLDGRELESAYWRAYRDFYRWSSILRSAARKPTHLGRLRHFAYSAGWKKFEPLWSWIIRSRQLCTALPMLETVLSEFGRRLPSAKTGSSAGGRAAVPLQLKGADG